MNDLSLILIALFTNITNIIYIYIYIAEIFFLHSTNQSIDRLVNKNNKNHKQQLHSFLYFVISLYSSLTVHLALLCGSDRLFSCLRLLGFVTILHLNKESTCSVVVNVLKCDIIVNEFEPQSCYYVHYRTNTFRKDINYLVP